MNLKIQLCNLPMSKKQLASIDKRKTKFLNNKKAELEVL